MNWLKKLKCRREGHDIVSVIETIEKRLVHVRDYCTRCGWSTPYLPGGMVDYYRREYFK